MKSVFGILSSGVASMALFGMITSGGPLSAVAEGADALAQVLNPIVAAAPAGAVAQGEGVAPGGPAVGGPAAGGAAVAGGPAVAGPGVAGPVAGGAVVGGPDIVEGGPAIVEGPPPGPPLLHHFMYVARHRYYGGVYEHKMELMLFGDHSFKFIMPEREEWGGRGDWGHGNEEVCDDTGWTTGTWELVEDELCMTFVDGFSRHGMFNIGEQGPMLSYDGIRWNDILAAPVGPVGPAVEAGPVGPVAE